MAIGNPQHYIQTTYLIFDIKQGPLTTTNRSKKKFVTVLDRLLDESAVNIDQELDYDEEDKGNHSKSDEDVTADLHEVLRMQ